MVKIKYKIKRHWLMTKEWGKEHIIEWDFPDYLIKKYFEKQEMTRVELINE